MARLLIATRPVLTSAGEFTTGEPRTARDDREFEALKKHPSWRAAKEGDLDVWAKRLENDPALKASRIGMEAESANKKEGDPVEKPAADGDGKAGAPGAPNVG